MKGKFWPMLTAVGIVAVACGFYLLYAGVAPIVRDESGYASERGESEKEGQPTGAGDAYAWRLLAWRDENGEIPSNGISLALQQRDEYLDQQAAQDGFSDGGITHLNWVSRGPTNVGGRTRSIIVHPDFPNILWAGSVGGGVFKSFDSGASWSATNDDLQNFAISSMAIDPNDPDILYAGTGEGFFNHDALRGGGMFKSIDGGRSWEALSATVPAEPPSENHDWTSIDRISIAHNNSEHILAGARGGIWRSTNGGGHWTRERDARTALYVAFAPNDSSKAVAEILESNYTHRVVFYSENSDPPGWQNAYRDGVEFKIEDYLGRIELAYSPSHPNIVYALNGNVISKSIDGGQTYESRPTSGGSIGGSWYNNTLWVSPTNPNQVVAGGTHLFRSEDGGDSVSLISGGFMLTEQPHVDQHCIVSDPGYDGINNKKVYVCNDGGVYRTNDITAASATAGWQYISTGYQTAQYYGASGHGPSELVYGGTQDNGTLRLLNSSSTARLVGIGDGGFSAVDPTNNYYCYGEQTYLQIQRAVNCAGVVGTGPAATSIHSGIEDVPPAARAYFIAPFILDPNDPNRLLGGGASLWRSNNARGTPPIGWHRIRYTSDEHRTSAIAVAPGNSNIIWVAEADENAPGHLHHGRIYKTNNGLASPTPTPWIPIDNNNTGVDPEPDVDPLPNRYVTRILIDKDNSNVVYVTFGGFTPDNLYKTTNGGSTWQNITGPDPDEGGLPNVPIRGIARHPADADRLFVGTEIGVYTTLNGGGSWEPVMEGPANVSVDEVTFMSGTSILMAATHGRGIWTAFVPLIGPPPCNGCEPMRNDFNGDGRSEIAVMRHAPAPSPSATQALSTWHFQRSGEGYDSVQFGLPGDQIAPGDYDGDGKADITVFRESNGNWYCLQSSDGTTMVTNYGTSGDIAVPGDFDTDGVMDEAVFRPSTGYWYLNQTTEGEYATAWGMDTDVPVAEDFDGDTRDDLAVFRLKGDDLWYLLVSRGTVEWEVQFGLEGDIPVAGDYDGDGRADIALFRPSDGYWYIAYAEDEFTTYNSIPWGTEDDIPVPGDYDGDGKTDIAVWRPSDGNWYLWQSSHGMQTIHFGAEGDIPVNRKTVDAINNRPGREERIKRPPPPWARPQRRANQ